MLKILIADDEKYERDSIVNLIEENFKEKLTIAQAKNGREAIEIAEQIRPEIVIMDIKMPGINGIKAIEEIKKTAVNTYFIMLTAYDYFDFAVEAVKLNVKEYLLKPFIRMELIKKINDAIETVEKEKAKRKNDIENEEKINNLIGVLENELSYNIINNTLDGIDCNMYISYLNLNLDSAFSIIIKILASNYNNILKRKIWEYVIEFLKLKYKVIGTYRFTEDLVYFIQTERYFNAYEETIANIKIANDIKREVDRHFNVSIKIGIGNCYSGINYMSKSYEEANRAVNSNIGNDIIHINNIINYDKDKSNDNDKVKLFRKVEEYIISNIKEELSLESIAKNFNLSSCYFSRNFKEFIGCNLSDYINSLRIKKAKELLNNNEMSIKEIGYEVGYSDPNYFSKVFKKYEGYSPTEYKFK
ncbi:response regulator [Clostridium sp. DSM 100503]|uniref:response regulator n=1 Tax=Clostridium sp. DSM 100503 TaxID=2963282 RepID=UPI002149C5B5|nr:response regulator [Clostridium sp. DSM 100503]MCR1952369.1 response regulator [Clostridium sp. DSM 100503]